LAKDIGLQVQPAKCEVYSKDSEAAFVVAKEVGIQFVPSEEGNIVAGMPVGSDPFAKQHADSMASKVSRVVETLLEIPLSAQNAFLLLRKSLQLRTSHLPRCVAWEQVEDALERVQHKDIDAACDILTLDLDENDAAAPAGILQMVIPQGVVVWPG
jgi:hypothetical protein